MHKVKIITDSCSDLTPELMERYGIDYAKMNTVYEGVTSAADLAWTPEEVHSFYNIMRSGKRITTTQVPVDEFNRVFGRYIAEGYDIVYIACASKQSGSVNTAHVLAEKLMADNPGRTVISVDSYNASLGEGLLAIEAAKMNDGEHSAREIADYIISIRKRVNEYVTVHSLDALRRSGRVKGPAAFFGNLMGVKPIIISDVDGEQAAFRKVKGRQTSFREIVSMLKESIENPENQTVFLAHADCSAEEVEVLRKLIRDEINCREVYVGYIGPIIGASIGPDAVGIFALGKQVTFRAGA